MIKSNNVTRSLIFCLAIFIIAGMATDSYSREMSEYPQVKLQSLDKVTAHTTTFEANIGDTLKFGSLYIKVLSCQKSSPMDEPESAAFIQIWEVDKDEKSQWVFSGWMFASSPGLSSIDHPIYDVWVLDCFGNEEVTEEINKSEE